MTENGWGGVNTKPLFFAEHPHSMDVADINQRRTAFGLGGGRGEADGRNGTFCL